jgi:hypothetical protein
MPEAETKGFVWPCREAFCWAGLVCQRWKEVIHRWRSMERKDQCGCSLPALLAIATAHGTERFCQPRSDYRHGLDAGTSGAERSVLGLSFHLRSSVDALRMKPWPMHITNLVELALTLTIPTFQSSGEVCPGDLTKHHAWPSCSQRTSARIRRHHRQGHNQS